MPSVDFNEDINFPGTRNQFISLENKGEKIRFRLAGKAHYQGQHWVPGEDQPVDCPKINENGYCEYCEKFENKELPSGVEVDKKGKITKGRNWYKPAIQFMFPILNRDTGEAQIFRTSLMVHLDIREADKAGINVYKSDWQVTRNEGSPAKYYSTVRLDPTKLNQDDKKTLEEAKNIDLEMIFKKSLKTSSMKGSEEVEEPDKSKKNKENVNPGDIPNFQD